jgi:DNA-directed RNA polymerase I, II, and III subunit RPABC1
MHTTTESEIARSYCTIREMVHDRGQDASSLDSLPVASVVALGGVGKVFHVDAPSCSMRVVYDMHPKFKVADVKKLVEEASAAGLTQVLLVVREPPVQGKGLDELAKDVQMFLISELQINVSKHTLVPLHEPIRDEAEIEAVLQRYQLKSRFQLPLLLSSDAMAKYLALKPGQVVRITRPSPSAGTYIQYRCCTRG